MSVFISYNRKDNVFAERLAKALAVEGIKVWKDSWRIGVGDSLFDTVQKGLEDARFCCILFSKNSLESEWVKRETAAAFTRELKRKQVTILPLLLDDSEIPSLLADKLYADFRTGFQKGLKSLLEVVLPYYRVEPHGRIARDDKYFIHFKTSMGQVAGKPGIDLTVVSFDLEEPYSMLTQLFFTYLGNVELPFDTPAEKNRQIAQILKGCRKATRGRAGIVSVPPGRNAVTSFDVLDEHKRPFFRAYGQVTTVGEIPHLPVQFNFGAILSQIVQAIG